MLFLAVFLSAAAAVCAFCYILFVRKFSWKSALPFSIAVFLIIQFLSGQKWIWFWTISKKPPAYLLVDRSLSMRGYFTGEVPPDPGYTVREFAAGLTGDSRHLDRQSTALFDAIRRLREQGGPKTRIFTISDLRDNASLSPLESTEDVIPILFTNTAMLGAGPRLARLDMPDYYETGEVLPLRMDFVSSAENRLTVVLKTRERVILENSMILPKGSHAITLQPVLNSEGAGLVNVQWRSGNSGSEFSRSVYGFPSRPKILFLCGRPSPEFAFVRRFLGSLAWIKTDVRILLRPGERFSDWDAGRYQGILVMDVSPDQLQKPDLVSRSRIPVFYQTGLRSGRDIHAVTGISNLFIPLKEPTAVNMGFGGEELQVLTSVAGRSVLTNWNDNLRIFTGWETWKWDFQEAGKGISLNRFERFWQNQVQFLLRNATPDQPFRTLNVFPGELDPVRFPTNGIYAVVTNGKRYLIAVQDNPVETSGGPGIDTAVLDRFKNRIVFAGWKDLKENIRALAATGKIRQRITVTLDPAQDPLFWIALFGSLMIFWVLKDRETAGR